MLSRTPNCTTYTLLNYLIFLRRITLCAITKWEVEVLKIAEKACLLTYVNLTSVFRLDLFILRQSNAIDRVENLKFFEKRRIRKLTKTPRTNYLVQIRRSWGNTPWNSPGSSPFVDSAGRLPNAQFLNFDPLCWHDEFRGYIFRLWCANQ